MSQLQPRRTTDTLNEALGTLFNNSCRVPGGESLRIRRIIRRGMPIESVFRRLSDVA